eukprot:10258848-Lingulodinium_polyedra.AAC.1
MQPPPRHPRSDQVGSAARRPSPLAHGRYARRPRSQVGVSVRAMMSPAAVAAVRCARPPLPPCCQT